MQTLRVLSAVLLATACRSGANGLTSPTFTQARTYAHDLFPSAEACRAAQRGSGLPNCQQWLTLCPSGRVDFIVTDIINRGTYRRTGGMLVLSLRANPEVSTEIVFDVAADEQSMTERRSGTSWIWRSDQTTVAWAARDCAV